MSTPDDFSDTDLSAWLDGELDAERRAPLDAWLREHPEAAARARLWAADRDALRARLDPVLGEAGAGSAGCTPSGSIARTRAGRRPRSRPACSWPAR